MEILTNKQYKEYDRVSRYSPFPIYYNTLDNKYIYGITAQLKKDTIRYVAHKVVEGDTLDTLALYYYNSPTYYWIIADFNDIIDPYKELSIDSVIKIPTFSDVEYNF